MVRSEYTLHLCLRLFANYHAPAFSRLDALPGIRRYFYSHYIPSLRRLGAPGVNIGCESHIASSPPDPADVLQRLDALHADGIGVRVTEFDIDTPDDEVRHLALPKQLLNVSRPGPWIGIRLAYPTMRAMWWHRRCMVTFFEIISR